jgi:hypothetical protein
MQINKYSNKTLFTETGVKPVSKPYSRLTDKEPNAK